jgi:hypothetical protein
VDVLGEADMPLSAILFLLEGDLDNLESLVRATFRSFAGLTDRVDDPLLCLSGEASNLE